MVNLEDFELYQRFKQQELVFLWRGSCTAGARRTPGWWTDEARADRCRASEPGFPLPSTLATSAASNIWPRSERAKNSLGSSI